MCLNTVLEILPNLEELIIGLFSTYEAVSGELTPLSVVYSLSVLKYASHRAAHPWRGYGEGRRFKVTKTVKQQGVVCASF